MARDFLYPPSVTPGIPKLGKKPLGWNKVKFQDVLEIATRPAKVQADMSYQLVTAKRNRGGIIPREVLLGSDIKTKTQFYVKEGDFLISKRQIVHGACGLVPSKLNDALVSNEYSSLVSQNGLCLKFFNYYSHTVHFQQTCFHSSVGVAIEKMIFRINEWMKHEFYLPPIKEQEKIAEILGKWDEGIEKVEKLIAAKQKRKKGLMEQLLTGKKRFKEFKGQKWKKYQLHEVVETLFSNVDKKSHENELPVLLCNYMDVYKNQYITDEIPFMQATAKESEVYKFSLKLDDVVITKDSETPDDIANSAVVIKPLKNVLCGYHLAILRPLKNVVSGLFLAHMLMLQVIRHQFSRVANGATRFGLSVGDIKKIPICIPSIYEQQKIASVLKTANREIEPLSDKLESLKQQKKGLMQKLLTGKIRVKV